MIFVFYNEEYDAYKFMFNTNGVLNTVANEKLVSVIEGDRNDLKTIKKLLQTPSGWAPASEQVKKFIFNREMDVTVTIAMYKDRMFISLSDIAQTKRYLRRELYYDVKTDYIEYCLPSHKFAEMINSLERFHIKHSVYQLNDESRQILAGFEEYKKP